LGELSSAVTDLLGIDGGHCWVMWNRLAAGDHYRPQWQEETPAAPVALVTCKVTYPRGLRNALVQTIATGLSKLADVDPQDVYVALRPVDPGDLWVRGALWTDEDLSNPPSDTGGM
jgi:phenylpyruvate tautomerase PptA (4-oxalocrotonate tautomerase family)